MAGLSNTENEICPETQQTAGKPKKIKAVSLATRKMCRCGSTYISAHHT
jgi:hypothetical protein